MPNLNHINKKIIHLALPMAGTQLITVVSSFLCMVMVAKLGHTVLAASALIFSTQTSVMFVSMSILFSLSILIGHAYGEKNYSAIGNFLQQGWTIGFLISLPLIIFFWHIGAILIALGQDKSLADIVQTYFHAVIWRIVPLMLSVSNQQLCYGVRKQHIDLMANALGIILLLMSAYVLIFGKLGFPQLGVAGLGYAFSIQGWFYFLFTTLYFYFAEFFKPFAIFKYRVHKHWNYLTRMLKMGWPISLQILGEISSFFVSAIMIGWLGIHGLAAFQVVTQYLFLILIPIFAISQACGVLVGQANGSRQFHEIKKLGYTCIRLALLISIIIGLLFILIPRHLASLYLDVHNPTNVPTVHYIVLLFAVVAFSQFFDSIRNVLTGALRGLFDTKIPMLISILTIWLIGMPLAYIFAFIFHWGVVGITAGSTVGVIVGALLIIYRWHTLTKRFS